MKTTLLNGPPAVGKTTAVLSMLEEDACVFLLSDYWRDLSKIRRAGLRVRLGSRIVHRLLKHDCRLDISNPTIVRYLFNLEKTMFFLKREKGLVVDEGIVQNVLSVVVHGALPLDMIRHLLTVVYFIEPGTVRRLVWVDSQENLVTRRQLRQAPQDAFWLERENLSLEEDIWNEVIKLSPDLGIEVINKSSENQLFV